jgi:ATP synthase protein I
MPPAASITSAPVGYSDEVDAANDGPYDRPYKRLTAQDAAELAAREPALSPWKVVGAQAGFGVLLGLLAWAVSGSRTVGVSALYGALVVVVPGLLMARGTTSPLGRVSPVVGAVSVMVWAGVKMATSVLMLVVATRVVQPLSWPALLVGLVACLQVYWFALLWRGRSKN